MSVKIMSRIFESTELGPTKRIIMLSLADHADDEGRCYPSIERLCQRTGLKERAVQSNIRELEREGYVRVEKNAGRRGSNLYYISATPAGNAPPQEMHPAADAPTPRRKCTPNPAADAPKPSVTITEPSKKIDLHRFSSFWDIWPNKVSKPAAERAWKKLKPDERQQAIEAVQSWFPKWRAANPQAAPIHASTYLNNHRWQDEMQHSASGQSNIAKYQAIAGGKV